MIPVKDQLIERHRHKMADTEIEALVRTTLQTKIIAAFKDTPTLVDTMVQAALSKPVDKETGRVDGYGSKVPYLEWITGEMIREAARNSVREIVRGMSADIDAAIKEKLQSGALAEAMQAAFIKAAIDDEWRINISFDKEEKKKY